MKLFQDAKSNIQGVVTESLFASRSSMPVLRMAPMIDMIFLLLIFFLLTARFRPMENFLPVNLEIGGPAAGPSRLVEPLTIHISSAESGCKVQLGRNLVVNITEAGPEVGLTLLTDKLAVSLREQKRNIGDPVEIICADTVNWEHTARIYSVLYSMGITDITFRMTD